MSSGRSRSPPKRRSNSSVARRCRGNRAACSAPVSGNVTSDNDAGGHDSSVRESDALAIARLAVTALESLGTTRGTTVPMHSVVSKIHSLAAMSCGDSGASTSHAQLLSSKLKILAQADPSHVSAELKSTIAEGLIVVMRSDSPICRRSARSQDATV